MVDPLNHQLKTLVNNLIFPSKKNLRSGQKYKLWPPSVGRCGIQKRCRKILSKGIRKSWRAKELLWKPPSGHFAMELIAIESYHFKKDSYIEDICQQYHFINRKNAPYRKNMFYTSFLNLYLSCVKLRHLFNPTLQKSYKL